MPNTRRPLAVVVSIVGALAGEHAEANLAVQQIVDGVDEVAEVAAEAAGWRAALTTRQLDPTVMVLSRPDRVSGRIRRGTNTLRVSLLPPALRAHN